jgi:hypothetical protein
VEGETVEALKGLEKQTTVRGVVKMRWARHGGLANRIHSLETEKRPKNGLL